MELEYLRSDDFQTYMARGHVDLGEMKAAVVTEEGGEAKGFEEPKHEWFRAVPKKGFDVWYQPADANSRGAFPVTIMARPW